MVGRISQQTSQAVYDDTREAYRDPGHPCHLFRTLQREELTALEDGLTEMTRLAARCGCALL